MSLDKLFANEIDRRDFLRKSTDVGLGLTGLLYGVDRFANLFENSLEGKLSLSPQEAEAMGCAPGLKETRKDVEIIDWDCNPILPIPVGGCYTGTNYQILPKNIKLYFTLHYGITPTFHTIGRGIWGSVSENFRKDSCETLIEDGIIPMIRYVILPFEGYKPIIKGKHDDDISKFAHQAAEFEHPIVLVPFQFPNDFNNTHYPWAGYSAGQYKDAWVHMHELFEKEGANKNTVWSIKLKMGRWATKQYPDPFQYCPPKEYVDIIGWACLNIIKPQFGYHSQSFKSLFNYYYKRAASKYPTKPQMFWELASTHGPSQVEWLDQALSLIKEKYFRVKGVMLDEQYYSGIGDRFGSHDPTPTFDSQKVIKKHFTSPYYIGSVIKK